LWWPFWRVDNDVLNWFPTLKNFYRCHLQNGCHNTTQIQHCPISTPFHMWVDYDVPNWVPTLPVEIFQCQKSIRDIIIYPHIKFWWYRTMLNFSCIVISHVGRLWCPELIPDIEQFLLVAIFKMATTISQKFNFVQYHHNLICG
jgi:hypothetical protein